jgi:hypothetical protein
MSKPTAVGVGGPLFVTARSALELTIVFAVELLFAGLLSAVVLVTFAVLLSVVPFGVAALTFTTIVKVAEAPLTSDAIEHVVVAPVVQRNAGPVVWFSETNVVPAGSVSLNETVEASDGPPFATVMV